MKIVVYFRKGIQKEFPLAAVNFFSAAQAKNGIQIRATPGEVWLNVDHVLFWEVRYA